MSSSKICMNGLCGAKMTPQWKRGWPMKAGGFATLCYSCGTAYEHVNYCERFHLNEPGWRECKFCDKPVHCGCVVSKYLHECLDLGGISCIKCIRARGTQALKPIQSYPSDIPNGFVPFSGTWHPSIIGKRMNGGASVDKGKLTQLSEAIEKHQPSPSSSSIGHQIRQDENRLPSGELGMGFSSSKDVGTIFPSSSSLFATPDNGRPDSGLKALYEAMPQPSLSYSLANALATTKSSVLSNPSGVVDGREPEKVPSFKQGQRSRLTFPKPSKSGVSIRSQSNKGMVSDNRVARPPAEGRGRNQLLPRYWPKITDQELLQISGDLNSNCTITPLFEKVLSASDAGRIGRLVLPKACAEAYFPAINQSEGLPIRIQDIKGKEWTFQFRFWPNNNSRMYVLEGVTPCIQNMQLQAGDTVIFSRLDPGEKLVIGCRKAAVSADTQEAETPAVNGVTGGTSSGTGNPSTKNSEHEGMRNGDSVQRPVIQEKKKTRNIGSKNKRLLMHNEDAMELKVTWEEAHELLRPSPTSKPTVSMIENCEFEEYDEPPVFGKKTIFTEHASGSQEQWGQCDSCSRWRRLPPDVLLPPKWTCSDNIWDPDRCSCSAPDEISTRDLERIFKVGKDLKKRKLAEGRVVEEPSGLDALATAAVLGESIGEFGESSAGPTTRHPRHRPGCTCIVCIQPPSGKGKHKPNCFCNVCLTVKRRFKTLMLRKKKRMSDREAEVVQKPLVALNNGMMSPGGRIIDQNGMEVEVGESSSSKGGGQLDLNCDPDKEEEMMAVDDGSGIIPLEWKNVLAGLVPCAMPKRTNEIEGRPPVEGDLNPSSSETIPTHPPTDETASPMDDDDAAAAAAAKVEMEKAVEDG
ncbi:B3 domain-containing transcription repressor VAL1 isoform X1 [Cynara cardunculus var. scolymus]|uniref:B3 domain-containing transcription repressor VAL1 isoform X1 n=2 Tax=Cynara cardunculus var. scolymus TaxID=59895 RepID=UPI000D62E64A|nr:B3 domain-containing transcription repressor VAL1 isoform X1 [Cynara cardunculus var. scolymus]